MERLKKSDYDTLTAQRQLNDKIINVFLKLIEKRSKDNSKFKKILAFDSFFFCRWDRNKAGYEGVKNWARQNPLNYDLVFFPVHLVLKTLGGVGHWALLVARPKHREIVSFDSLGMKHNSRLKQLQLYFKEEEAKRKKLGKGEWTIVNMLKKCPQQKNSYDCGVYVCCVAELLSQEKNLTQIKSQTSKELRKDLERKLRQVRTTGCTPHYRSRRSTKMDGKAISPKTLKVEKHLNVCKGLSIALENYVTQQCEPSGGVGQSITTMAHVRNVRTSKRLKEKFKDSRETLELQDKEKEEEALKNSKKIPSSKEVSNKSMEEREGLLKKVTKEIKQTKSYVEEDLLKVNNQKLKRLSFGVVKVKSYEEEDSSSSDDQLNIKHEQKRQKITRMTPRVLLKLPDEEKNAMKALKKRNAQLKLSVNNPEKVSKADTLRKSSRVRPLSEITTNIEHGKVSNLLTRKNSTKTTEETPSSSLSKDEDSAKTLKPFSCKRCDKSFQYASGLKAHKLTHTVLKPYTCDHCSTSFRQKSHLRRHLSLHEKSAKKFKCTSCEMTFHQKTYLLVHKRVHSGVKPYTCGECSKSFSQKSHLNTHMKSHQQKEYSCDVCHKCFTLLHHLSTHIQSVHK